METKDLEQGKIYFVSYGTQTQLVGRFKEESTCDLYFYDYLHYWNSLQKENALR